MRKHIGMVAAAFLSAVACGTTFLLALHRQYGLVEVAASLATGAEVYFLSSSIGDWLEDRKEGNRVRMAVAVVLATGVVGYFLLTRRERG